MQSIERAGAWCNGEIGYLAWRTAAPIPDCLGFMITRVHETGADAGQRRILPSWIAFKDQSNRDWNQQDTSVWPIQRFEWRDLTLRKSRDTTAVRPIDFRVHYEIVPVGLPGPGRTAIPPSDTAHPTDDAGRPSYEGTPRALFMIGTPTATNAIDVTHEYGAGADRVAATFTNGILSTQNLLRQLESVGKGLPVAVKSAARSPGKAARMEAAKAGEQHLLAVLQAEIVKEASPIRAFLTGDVFGFLTALLDRAATEGGEVYLALYELHDEPLIKRLVEGMKRGRLHIILSTAGNVDPNPAGTAKADRQPVLWDTGNDDARRQLHAAAGKRLADRMTDRMFNGSARIGHNKFAVYVKDGKAAAVLTGSTNWTPTGLCTQSNNSIIVENPAIADDYWGYWKRLRDDRQPPRVPLTGTDKEGKLVTGAAGGSGSQGAPLRTADAAPPPLRSLGRGTPPRAGQAKLWCAPNTKAVTVPKTDPAIPPDLAEVYALMDGARQAVLFLSFLPGVSGRNNIIGKARELAAKRGGPLVIGAISDPSALPPPSNDPGGPETFKDAAGREHKIPPPAIWWPDGEQGRIVMIRAAAVRVPFGNLRPELLTAGHAIIHDKVIVIDPLDPVNCAVVTGSHNLGFKASYCNDDNMLIIRGNRDLAVSYAVHTLDLYDHYVFRARLEQDLRDRLRTGQIHSFAEAAGQEKPHGLLRTDSHWQDRQFAPRARSSADYFLDGLTPPDVPPGSAPKSAPGSAPGSAPLKRKRRAG